MADNVVLNSGAGGATMRTLQTSTLEEWPASVVAYATTLSPGANVLQVVTASAGLPVAQQGTWTVTVSGTSTISGTVTANIGTTGGLALDTSVSGILVAQGSTTSGEKGPLIQGAVTTSAPSYTTAQSNPLSLDTAGNLRTLCSQTGTWNIGSITTLPAIPAGTNLIGSAAVGHQIAQVYQGTTAITPSYATFSTSASGATSVVAAVTSKKIYVLRWRVSSNGNTNVNLQSHTTTSQATGLCYLTQYASSGGAYCPAGIMATASGEALDVNNSAAIAISGEVTYVAF
jgi:hypothetical protein